MRNYLALTVLALSLYACGDDNKSNSNAYPYGVVSSPACANPGINQGFQGCDVSRSVDQFGNCTAQFINDYNGLRSNLQNLRVVLQGNWGGPWFQAAQAAKQSCDGFFSVHGMIACNANGANGFNQQPNFTNQPGFQGHHGHHGGFGNISGQIFVDDCRSVSNMLNTPSNRPVF